MHFSICIGLIKSLNLCSMLQHLWLIVPTQDFGQEIGKQQKRTNSPKFIFERVRRSPNALCHYNDKMKATTFLRQIGHNNSYRVRQLCGKQRSQWTFKTLCIVSWSFLRSLILEKYLRSCHQQRNTVMCHFQLLCQICISMFHNRRAVSL